MTRKQSKIYIRISDVFPHVQNDFETFKSLLCDLSLTDTLFWCARLNLIISDSSDIDPWTRQKFGIKQFLTPEEIGRIDNFVQKQGGTQKVVIFFRGQLLELLRWSALYSHNHLGDGKTFEDHDVRRKFVQAMLISSDVWACRVFEKGITLGAIRKSIEASTLSLDISKSLGRGWSLFKDYFPRYYQSFDSEFLYLTGISVEEYYICLSVILTNFMNPQQCTGIFRSETSRKTTLYNVTFKKFITLISQTTSELREALWGKFLHDSISNDDIDLCYDYRPLREKPILRTYDERAIILDPVFYSEKASVGPLFYFLGSKVSHNQADTIIGKFGEAFENYACDILKRMFPDLVGISGKRLSCDVRGKDQAGREFQIDACINDITEVVLFEMKAVFIREDKILTDDDKSYQTHLREKYGVSKGSSRDRKIKGVGQLARIINIFASKEWLEQNQEYKKVQLIYPVLVVHDSLLAAPNYGSFFASEFKTYLSPDKELRTGDFRKGQFQIVPLIVMTIEDLENLETSIEYFGFRKFLADYSRSCPNRSTSLYDFMASSKKYSYQIYPNRNIATKAFEILSKCEKAVFPEEAKKIINVE